MIVVAVCLVGGGVRPGSAAGQEGPRFTRVTVEGLTTDRASTGGAAWVDVDGDGDSDLVVTNGYDVSSTAPVPQGDRLYLNDGSGGFTPAPAGPFADAAVYSSGSTWGDFDNDGDVDAFVAGQRHVPGALYRNAGRGRLDRVLDRAPALDSLVGYAAAWADADADGALDLFVFAGGLSALAVNAAYRGAGDGTFERVSDLPAFRDSAAWGGGVWADYDNDGDNDLFVPVNAMRGGPRHLLLRNDGGWRFTRQADAALGGYRVPATAAAWADYDNDGDMDLYVGAERGVAGRLFRNTGEGAFEPVLDVPPSWMAGGNQLAPTWADFDNDGDQDLLVVRWGAASTLFLNDGRGGFAVPLGTHGDLERTVTHKSSVAVADYDADGDLDVYMGNWPDAPGPEEENMLFRNDGPVGDWMRIRLEGTRSNRSAIGARVSVTAMIGGRRVTQHREVQAQTTWRSQDEAPLHFGLGDDGSPESVGVRWPSGLVETCRGVPSGARVVVVEGRGWRLEGSAAEPTRCSS